MDNTHKLTPEQIALKKQLKNAVKYLKAKEIIDNDKDIADALKYTKGATSDILNGNKPFSFGFRKKFEEHYNIDITKIPMKFDATKDDIVIKNTEVGKEIGSMMEKLIDAECTIAVLKESHANLYSLVTKRLSSLISGELDEAILMMKKRRFAELRRKRG